ncbi:MAG: PA0069 family radical SAM protein, partial [Pseudomonadales bacterium]|nr:PA0069 family radical SAM protein [Pseudomonadales bacterium]
CEHGCIYCFARPTHAYLDLSPGLDFETRIFYKTGVRERLQAELSHPGYQVQPIALGTNTDPYQPAEKQLRVTREILELLLEWRHPLTIVTKSQLILRDLDLLEEMARMHLVQVHLSVTTLSNDLKVKLEPRTASPAARLRTVRALSEAGVPAGVMVAPVIPFINDAEMEAIIAAGVAAGARRFGYILLRLPLEVAPLFEEWLDTHYPLKKTRVLNAVRQTRGGRLYDAAWGTRMTGRGEIAQLLQNRFRHALRKQGIDAGGFDAALRSNLFSHPGYQASLF